MARSLKSRLKSLFEIEGIRTREDLEALRCTHVDPEKGYVGPMLISPNDGPMIIFNSVSDLEEFNECWEEFIDG